MSRHDHLNKLPSNTCMLICKLDEILTKISIGGHFDRYARNCRNIIVILC